MRPGKVSGASARLRRVPGRPAATRGIGARPGRAGSQSLCGTARPCAGRGPGQLRGGARELRCGRPRSGPVVGPMAIKSADAPLPHGDRADSYSRVVVVGRASWIHPRQRPGFTFEPASAQWQAPAAGRSQPSSHVLDDSVGACEGASVPPHEARPPDRRLGCTAGQQSCACGDSGWIRQGLGARVRYHEISTRIRLSELLNHELRVLALTRGPMMYPLHSLQQLGL